METRYFLGEHTTSTTSSFTTSLETPFIQKSKDVKNGFPTSARRRNFTSSCPPMVGEAREPREEGINSAKINIPLSSAYTVKSFHYYLNC